MACLHWHHSGWLPHTERSAAGLRHLGAACNLSAASLCLHDDEGGREGGRKGGRRGGGGGGARVTTKMRRRTTEGLSPPGSSVATTGLTKRPESTGT
jgi:hypothetical protein